MKIYISLPISGFDVNRQREKADAVKAFLSRHGHRPVSPFDICVGKNPKYADYLCADLRALSDCDAIYLCEGWHQSRGCRIEGFFASEFGLKVIYENGGDRDRDNYYMNR